MLSPDWHPEVLPAAWPRAADALHQRGMLGDFYLAGGTGLALQLGHRRSVDLDLFSTADFDSRRLRDRLRDQEGLQDVALAPGTAHLALHGVKVSFLHYPYPLLFPLRRYEALEVADARDIACMNIDVIGSRGSRRDFVDLYVAGRQFGLEAIIEWFGAKYASVATNRTHVLKALTYFTDAEHEPMPDMIQPIAWTAVTDYFVKEVPRLVRLDPGSA